MFSNCNEKIGFNIKKLIQFFILSLISTICLPLTANEFDETRVVSETTLPAINLLDNLKFKEFLDAYRRLSKASDQLSLPEFRKLSTQFFVPPDTIYETINRIENVVVLGKNQNKIPIRIFIPDVSKILPVIVYFHRGGWVFGNIEEADPVCRKLANHLGCIVASVEYRLAPENPFPKPLEDCYDATQWIAKNASHFGGDRANLIVCGESAGGNLAAAVALMARDVQEPSISAQLLIYPVISSSIEDASYDKCVDRYFLTKDAMNFFWSMYLKSPGDDKNPYASPDQATDFTRLPPALIITAEYDPLRDEADKYAKNLHEAGVNVILRCFSEVIHGFIDLPFYHESQKIGWIKEIGKSLKNLEQLKESK